MSHDTAVHAVHTSTQTFADRVRAIPGGEHLEMCYSCGTCVSKCLIQQKAEPRFNPRRLLRMVMMGMEHEAFSDPTTWLCSACDLCYPACPQQIHISGVIGAVKQLAIAAGYSSPLTPVCVDETLCSGCGICVMACPYEAPSLIDKQVDGKMDRFSSVDANKCLGCGTCVAACPLGAIARPGVSNAEVIAQMGLPAGNSIPKLIAFVCDWSLRAETDLSILESYSPTVRVVHIPCTGRIDPEMALRALVSGIDGVLVCGCKPGECHYKRGTDVAFCKLGLFERALSQMIDKTISHRIRLIQIGTQDRGRIRSEIDHMLEALEAHL